MSENGKEKDPEAVRRAIQQARETLDSFEATFEQNQALNQRLDQEEGEKQTP